MTTRFDVKCNPRGTFEHLVAERALEVASAMGQRVLMLQNNQQQQKGSCELDLRFEGSS
jgi:hypothetical protein